MKKFDKEDAKKPSKVPASNNNNTRAKNSPPPPQREKTPIKPVPKPPKDVLASPRRSVSRNVSPLKNVASEQEGEDDEGSSHRSGTPDSIYDKPKRPANLLDPNQAIALHRAAHDHMKDL